MENKTVNVLGENYSIMFVDEYPELFSDFEETSDALCNFYDKVIYVLNPKEKDLTENGKMNLNKKKLRHEIVRAFLFESGLSSNTHGIYGAWAENEEMVDWIAIQSPKIFKVFQELEIL